MSFSWYSDDVGFPAQVDVDCYSWVLSFINDFKFLVMQGVINLNVKNY